MVSKPESEKPKMGRPEYQPNEKHELIVRALCLFGAPHTWISSYIGITDKTLRKHYPELLANCKADKNYAAESALFVQVIRGNVEAIKYWLDNHNKQVYNKLPPTQVDDNNQSDVLKLLAEALKGPK